MTHASGILFVSDRFVSDSRSARERQPGGAELTDQAAVASCPRAVELRRWREIRPTELARYDLIIVSNAATATREQLGAVARTGRHVLFEHDLRLCRWRGDFCRAREPLHRFAMRCRCPATPWRELVESALGVIFLTERQRATYHDNPHYRRLATREHVLGGSLFSEDVLDRCHALARRGASRSHAAYAWSDNPIKGHRVAHEHCRRMGWAVREIRSRTYPETLAALGVSERFVHLPIGLEPAGRMPVEARLSGCEVTVNALVGVAAEPLWRMPGDEALSWLHDAPRRFWRLVEALANARAPKDPPPPTAAAAAPAPLLSPWELVTLRRRPDLADHWLTAGAAARASDSSVAPPWRTASGS